ncbi:hypothetical protein [Rhizobium sp. WW_1]|jgi:hypothetical protein|uniref:hypothetical protein n=1 Tax=Rhizobium sp. WW_1 TaxID=1907375 RepID=UPI000648E0A0|nr:hypothetical protein [Rhizobium sp. WW_1]RKD69003.1 hypothetical protein BJ928_104141 [Rhizobium sp. WW_1]
MTAEAQTITEDILQTERLDHGLLNIPLAKRGNIDAQIDRYVAEQRKAKQKEHSESFHRIRDQKKRVQDILSKIGDFRVMEIAKPLGCRNPSSARKALYQAALSNLSKWIAVLERESIPAGGCASCWAPVGKCQHGASEWLGEV